MGRLQKTVALALGLLAVGLAAQFFRDRRPPGAHSPALAVLSGTVDWAGVAASLYLLGEEYTENLEAPERLAARRPALLRLAAATLEQVQAAEPRAIELEAAVAALQPRLEGPVDFYLPTACNQLVERVVRGAGLREFPLENPDLVRGAGLFLQACAACHGPAANGQSAISKRMEPPPSDLLHPERSWRPADMFARVTYGGLETAMPSFKDGLTAGERWDIVFYLFAQRWGRCEQLLPPVSASVLAVSSDFDLSQRFRYKAIACLRQRFTPPPGAGEAELSAAAAARAPSAR